MASSSSSSSTSNTESPYHDEIKKAIAAAAEMRATSSENVKYSNDNDDTAPRTIFDKIIAGDIPCNKVYEDEIVLAFHDVNPVAPVHILVIPKVRNGLTQLSKSSTHQHQTTLGHAMMVASQIGKQYCKDHGYRIVINDGEHGGQSVYHLHIHVIGGRQMQWPPG
jgi:histidine triad (HIT) family protein